MEHLCCKGSLHMTSLIEILGNNTIVGSAVKYSGEINCRGRVLHSRE